MSDLLQRIAAAQREAGERVVMEDLKAKGLDGLVSAAAAESVIKPLRPKSKDWLQWPVPEPIRRMGYPSECWYLPEQMLTVMSAVEVAKDKDGIDRGPEYHISMSILQGPRPSRVPSHLAKWVLRQFGLEGAEEDNHVPNGIVRNYWRAVAEPIVGLECACKAEEPVIREDKGDFVWRP